MPGGAGTPGGYQSDWGGSTSTSGGGGEGGDAPHLRRKTTFAPRTRPKPKVQTGDGWTPGAGNRYIQSKGRRNTVGGITGGKSLRDYLNWDKYKETGGNLTQIVANMPKYWDLPKGLEDLIRGGKNIPFAAGLKTKEATEAIKKFGYEAMRPITKQAVKYLPTLNEMENAIRTKSLKALGQVEGVFGATGATMKDALAKGAQYAKSAGTRGIGKAGDLAQVLSGSLDPGTYSKGYFDRGMLGNVEFRGPAGDINRALNLGPKTAQVAGRPITQALTNRIGARLLPGANIALGGASALGHIQAGNYGQAAMAGLSMVPGPVGWAGLAGEMGLGALSNLSLGDPNAPENTLVMNRGGRVYPYSLGGLAYLLYGGRV